ncbi:MarR family transcriptional regulator [Nocardia brasiliensis]|uniref:MarR family transcriptional regulator n=1 Tax=Nocardia brasiliensis TaxID=37326 RepID=A0A6G9XVY5_NOCBR|nr:MarR family transcriptional regulator [Nocardia brasiliensis]QIS05094.1 MarR family transcriptional regulator [Nocardia brasiliensis]
MAVQRRIGYWLVELDRLITERFEEDLAAGGLSRRHWQILHALADGPQRAGEVRAALDAFLTDAAEWDAEVAALVAAGSVVADAGMLALTEVGRNIHSRAWTRIRARRRAMTEGVSETQFAETLWVLQKMAANMSDAAPARLRD